MDILIKEETFAGKVLDEIILKIEQECLTVAQLIEIKIQQEVVKHQTKRKQEMTGYTNLTEEALNDKKISQPEINVPDLEQEVYRALEAFNRNQMIITVNDKQVTSLEEEVLLNSQSEVSFMQLMPLVGG